MAGLVEAADKAGATDDLLIATEEGRALYSYVGQADVSDVGSITACLALESDPMSEFSRRADKHKGEAISKPTLYFLFGMMVLIVIASAMVLTFQRRSPYSHSRIGGPFVMTEMSGRPVTEKDLLGKPAALFFGYTFCPDVCPTTLLTLSNVLERMGPDADRLNTIFVTVDPQRDTPEQMRLYLSSFDPRIRGFSGTEAQVSAMADTFHVFYRRIPSRGGGYSMDHFAGVLLLDKTGRMVGEVSFGEPEESILAKLTTLIAPAACVPGRPARVDLWSGAKMKDDCGSS
ncbi:SCO family protein [Lichenifustis flavocetrariae]|uniref:SCO family protein n=1 Tax=Lichenifustis flavocetrariae TaxID=2949735 RepID=A0AA41YSW1_9HYPH|nr:SCO family protein [Lichenifustis flavocetrariae]MCW6506581.1 SCO family protein [Lichenifustis flavocetrariae]